MPGTLLQSFGALISTVIVVVGRRQSAGKTQEIRYLDLRFGLSLILAFISDALRSSSKIHARSK
jgi:hypothetical protein